MRKKNRILSCETVTRGYMIYVQTPNDQLHHRLYSGYSKRQALSMAISRQGLCATQLQDYADPAVLPINPQPADTGVSYSLSADLMTAAQLLREYQGELNGTVKLVFYIPQQDFAYEAYTEVYLTADG